MTNYLNLISATIIKDSKNRWGQRITTFKLVFPRFILAELNTHRLFSKNSASSRAIPFKKMVRSADKDTFIPIAWQKDHKGMQGNEYHYGDTATRYAPNTWLRAKDKTVSIATFLNNNLDVTKQLANRLLEPFLYHTVLLTATEFENFFNLRCPKYEIDLSPDGSEIAVGKSWKELMKWRGTNGTWAGDFATSNSLERLSYNKGAGEIHIMDLAEKMYDAYNESIPEFLPDGAWHIPFMEKDTIDEIVNYTPKPSFILPEENTAVLESVFYSDVQDNMIKIATARCARLSYETLGDNPTIDFDKDIKLHDDLLAMYHMSPFEHCARAMTKEEYLSHFKGIVTFDYIDADGKVHMYVDEDDKGFGWSRNFRGFIQYRELVENV